MVYQKSIQYPSSGNACESGSAGPAFLGFHFSKEVKETLPTDVSEDQLIVAFFYLLMTSPSDVIINDETCKIIKSAFKKELIDDAVVFRIKDLFSKWMKSNVKADNLKNDLLKNGGLRCR